MPEEQEEQEEQDESSEAYKLCKTFRRFARQAKELNGEGELHDQKDRTLLIEHLVDEAGELDVWSGVMVRGILTAALCLFEGDDKEAMEILNHLADEELRSLRGNVDEEESGEDDDGLEELGSEDELEDDGLDGGHG